MLRLGPLKLHAVHFHYMHFMNYEMSPAHRSQHNETLRSKSFGPRTNTRPASPVHHALDGTQQEKKLFTKCTSPDLLFLQLLSALMTHSHEAGMILREPNDR